MAISNLIDDLGAKAKKAVILWLEGFREACCLHRVVFFCLRSKMLAIRTGQCFLLNGFIFLGSILILNSVIIPVLEWILPYHCQQFGSQDMCASGGVMRLFSFLRHGLIQLFYIFWFYPLYVFSFVLSNIWYNDIAKHAYIAMGRHEHLPKPSSQSELLKSQNLAHTDKPAGLGRAIIGIGEQVYSVLLLSVFFVKVFAAGFIPYIGKALNFLLLSWMYAYYCFEYKWNLSELGLDKRLDFFESNWAFFAGFGSPCVLAIFFFPPLVSYGVMAVLFPLFVLTATGSRAEDVIDSRRRMWRGAGLGRLPIFYASDTISMRLLSLLAESPQGQLQDKND